MYCRICGKEIPEDSRFCSFCGAEQGGTVSGVSIHAGGDVYKDVSIEGTGAVTSLFVNPVIGKVVEKAGEMISARIK